MPIVWSDKFVIGIEKLDEQHRGLIDALNRLEEAIRTGEDPAVASQTLDLIESCASEHFAYEEACMDAARCPAAETNRLCHEAFIRAFGRVREEFERDGPTPRLLVSIQLNLVSWAVHHIGGVDCPLREYAGRLREPQTA
jgi:hemerythrin-like metal-binding protein